jgi:N-methylhydantoinase A
MGLSSLYVASDIGGTFTDTVTIDAAGRVSRYKAPTVPNDPAAGVLATLELAAADADVSLEKLLPQITFFAHGTTVATNAMLERKHAKVGLLQTRGFGDTLSIMRGFKSLGLDEAAMKDFRTLVKQELVVPKTLIAEVTERVDYMGRAVVPLDEDDVRKAVRTLQERGAETFAVSLLWSFKNPTHEKRIGEIIEEEVPGALTSLSSDLLPRMGEYRRSVTTALNASLRPVLRRAVRSLEKRLAQGGMTCEPLLMQSHGGLARIGDIDRVAASTVMSGPVGGVVACEYFGAKAGQKNIVATDMGGTSFEVGLILDGRAHIANSTWVGRQEIALPSVTVRTVGAGSGSLATVANGLLRVGPESAGAVPGPACYGAGGKLPTVADADLVLGYLNPDNFLGGRLYLDRELSRCAIEEHVARPLGLSIEEAAEGIKTIIDSRMADLIRQSTVEQGYDPTEFVIYAYGGAGPMHAFSYGAELGIKTIVVPVTASVHSAFGVAVSDLMVAEEYSDPILSPPGTRNYAEAIAPAEVNDRLDKVTERARNKLLDAGADPSSITVSRSVEMRFRFQINVLTVAVPNEPFDEAGIQALVTRFIETYESRFGKGSAFVAAGIELTTYRAVARAKTALGALENSPPKRSLTLEPPGSRKIYSRGNWRDATILRPEHLAADTRIAGLAVVEMPDTTIVIGEGQWAEVDAQSNLIIHLDANAGAGASA